MEGLLDVNGTEHFSLFDATGEVVDVGQVGSLVEGVGWKVASIQAA